MSPLLIAAGAAPWPKGAGGPAAHLRDIFYRMGLTDQVRMSPESLSSASFALHAPRYVHYMHSDVKNQHRCYTLEMAASLYLLSSLGCSQDIVALSGAHSMGRAHKGR